MDKAKTVADFYQQQCDVYHQRTVDIDPSSFLKPLIHHIAPGAKIIDVGCGSGRDMRWLKERGFNVNGFEKASGLADLARRHALQRHPGFICEVQQRLDYLTRRKLLLDKENLLVEVNRDNLRLARPETPLATSSPLTWQGDDPPLEHELHAEMQTADRVDNF